MVLVVSAVISWACVMLFFLMPQKLPPAANVVAYFLLSILDINKLSLLAFHFHYFKLGSELADFWAVVLHRDVALSFTLLIFMNAVHRAGRSRLLWVGTATYAFLLATSWIMQSFGAVEYGRWGWMLNAVLLLFLILAAWAAGRWVRYLAQGG